jgi:hypothetical protein
VTSDFLAELDAAVGQRCACLCGRPITVASPSAYYASENCAATWHQRRHPTIDAPTLAELMHRVGERIARELPRVIDALLVTLRRLHEQRERAVRTRGTGPQPRTRAPRTLDPPTGFTTSARGRRAWRPTPR